MMFRSKTHFLPCVCRSGSLLRFSAGARRKGFGLMEVVAALLILGFFSSGMMVVINGCIAWAANSAMRMQAFEVARDNMEKLLSMASVEEVSESGESEKYPEIGWQTDVETFYEPVTNRMWARAVCSAQYYDAEGEEQTIELEHWLASISKEQLQALLERDDAAQEKLAGQVFDTIEAAAAYAGVDVETIEQWIDKGLVPLEDGSIPKHNLDIFMGNNGNPPAEQIQSQIETEAELQQQQDTSDGQEPTIADQEAWLDEVNPLTGMTNREIEENPDEFWRRIGELLKNKN
jgi:hypothetical protein